MTFTWLHSWGSLSFLVAHHENYLFLYEKLPTLGDQAQDLAHQVIRLPRSFVCMRRTLEALFYLICRTPYEERDINNSFSLMGKQSRKAKGFAPDQEPACHEREILITYLCLWLRMRSKWQEKTKHHEKFVLVRVTAAGEIMSSFQKTQRPGPRNSVQESRAQVLKAPLSSLVSSVV